MDAAAQHPAFAEFARLHPSDWEEITSAKIRPMIEWQRIIGCHALIIGWSDQEPNPTYTNPQVVIRIGRWDGTDLFGLGLPRTYNGKPVVIKDIKDFPKPLGGTNGTRWWVPLSGSMSLTAGAIALVALLTVAGTVFLRLRLRGRSRV